MIFRTWKNRMFAVLGLFALCVLVAHPVLHGDEDHHEEASSACVFCQSVSSDEAFVSPPTIAESLQKPCGLSRISLGDGTVDCAPVYFSYLSRGPPAPSNSIS